MQDLLLNYPFGRKNNVVQRFCTFLRLFEKKVKKTYGEGDFGPPDHMNIKKKIQGTVVTLLNSKSLL